MHRRINAAEKTKIKRFFDKVESFPPGKTRKNRTGGEPYFPADFVRFARWTEKSAETTAKVVMKHWNRNFLLPTCASRKSVQGHSGTAWLNLSDRAGKRVRGLPCWQKNKGNIKTIRSNPESEKMARERNKKVQESPAHGISNSNLSKTKTAMFTRKNRKRVLTAFFDDAII